ncbi:MAG: alpha/beta hydrolase [Alphaproteobacteria bacterium]|nr:alpha/beta hydrolase [Alphaproteobacteria bacterium]
MHRQWKRDVLLLAVLAGTAWLGGTASGFETPPVKTVLEGRLVVRGATGQGELPVAVSQDWSKPLPDVTHAVIVVHGAHRAAAPLFNGVIAMAPGPSTLIIAPQFLIAKDVAAHAVPDNVLRWGNGHWATAGDASGPIAVSSYDAMDTLLATLGDRSRFPSLRRVVFAGFSAGGQLTQRYAAVGHGPEILSRSGIALRFVVGSPGSYLYLNPGRPAGPPQAATCPEYDQWPHGLGGGLPRYPEKAARLGEAALEQRYARLDLVYLVGTRDNDPNHWELGTSCGAEAEGADRYSRAVNYYRFMKGRDGAILNQRFTTAPGMGHDALAVLGSPCGRAALFDIPGCTAQGGD